jgi:hypothetical protein
MFKDAFRDLRQPDNSLKLIAAGVRAASASGNCVHDDVFADVKPYAELTARRAQARVFEMKPQ